MIWIKEEGMGPFDGLLIVMNIGEETPVPSDYAIVMAGEIDEAYAAGWLVLHVYDKGISVPPDEAIEGMCLPVLSSACGEGELKFDLMPGKRLEQLKKMASHFWANSGLDFTSRNCKVMGRCLIDGAEVFLPPQQIVE